MTQAQIELWFPPDGAGLFPDQSEPSAVSNRRSRLELAPMQAKLSDSAVCLELADTLNGMVILMSTRGVNLDSDRGCTAVRMMP